MLLKKDWLAQWFQLYEDLGENSDMLWLRFETESSRPSRLFMPHTKFDGFSCFAHLIHQFYGTKIEQLPRNPMVKNPGILKKLISTINFMVEYRRAQTSTARWKNFDPSLIPKNKKDAIPRCVGWMILSKDETERINAIAKARGVFQNSLLMWAMSKAILPSLVHNSGKIGWFVPVNMRGGISLENRDANHLTFLNIGVEGEDSVENVHRTIIKSFMGHMEWGGWYGLGTIGRWIGMRGMRALYMDILKRGSPWTATFSNLGTWPPVGVTLDHPDYAWCSAPPVPRTIPLSTSAITWNGKLTLGIQAHPSLSMDPKDAQVWLERWKMEIFQINKQISRVES